jgi:hypothetical protein
MSQILNPKKILTLFISIFSLIIAGITLISIIFPALIVSNFGIHSNNLDSLEVGINGYLILLFNVIIITFGIGYYKKILPIKIHSSISKLLQKNISQKVTIIIIFSILSPYVVLTIPELFIDEQTQAPDYDIFLAAKKIFPFGKTTFTEAAEQNDRYIRMILLIGSIEIFQNVKIIPFLGSIGLLIATYFLTYEITKNRFAGIISLLFLIQTFTFLKYDSFAMYENFWVLFYVLSLYLISKKFYTSSISYLLSILTKAFTVIYLPLSIVFIFYSDLNKKTKFLIMTSYAVMIGIVLAIWSLDASVYSNILRFEISELLTALAKTSYQLRFDYLFLSSFLPLTLALIIKAKNHVHNAASILFLISGSIFAGAIVEILSYHFVILPYRFVPTLVFFAVGIGILFNSKNSN